MTQTIKKVQLSCFASPSSWLLKNKKGETLVASYRLGSLVIHNCTTAKRIFRKRIGEPDAGYMEYEEMMDHAGFKEENVQHLDEDQEWE